DTIFSNEISDDVRHAFLVILLDSVYDRSKIIALNAVRALQSVCEMMALEHEFDRKILSMLAVSSLDYVNNTLSIFADQNSGNQVNLDHLDSFRVMICGTFCVDQVKLPNGCSKEEFK